MLAAGMAEVEGHQLEDAIMAVDTTTIGSLISSSLLIISPLPTHTSPRRTCLRSTLSAGDPCSHGGDGARRMKEGQVYWDLSSRHFYSSLSSIS